MYCSKGVSRKPDNNRVGNKKQVIMKKLILLLTLFFAVNVGFSQYTEIPLSDTYGDNVSIITRVIDSYFEHTLNKTWKLDKYVLKSARIRSYYETATKNRKPNGKYMIKVRGTYQYSRIGKTYSGTYEAIIAPNVDDYRSFRILSLIYEE